MSMVIDESGYKPRNTQMEATEHIASVWEEVKDNKYPSSVNARQIEKPYPKYDGSHTIGGVHDVAMLDCMHHWAFVHDKTGEVATIGNVPVRGTSCMLCGKLSDDYLKEVE